MRCVFGVNTSGVCKRRQHTSNPDTVLTSDFVHFLCVSHGRAFPDRCADREERTLSIPFREPFFFKRGVFNIVKLLGQIRYRVNGFWSANTTQLCQRMIFTFECIRDIKENLGTNS